MSAPRTNLDKQKRRHIGPLIGMGAVLVFVGIIFFWWMTHEVATADNPVGTPTDESAPSAEDVNRGTAEVADPPPPNASAPNPDAPNPNAPATPPAPTP